MYKHLKTQFLNKIIIIERYKKRLTVEKKLWVVIRFYNNFFSKNYVIRVSEVLLL